MLTAKDLELTVYQSSLHQRAISLSTQHKQIEFEILEILEKIEGSKLYQKLGYGSLFTYVVGALGFSESVAYSFILVMRKARSVPVLKEAFKNQTLTVSKVRRVVPILNLENAIDLIEFARTHTNREIEREVARLNPKRVSQESTERYLTEDVLEIRLCVSKKAYENFKRAQDLESQRTGKASTLPETLAVALEFYLKHKDPVQKAARVSARTEKKMQSLSKVAQLPGAVAKSQVPKFTFMGNRVTLNARKPLTANQKHTVAERDGGRCTFIGPNHKRCQNRRWVEVHHITEVSRGGSNEPSNLTTLCSEHHDLVHQCALPLEGQVSWLRTPRREYFVRRAY